MSKEPIITQTEAVRAILTQLENQSLPEEAHQRVLEAARLMNELERSVLTEGETLNRQVDEARSAKNKFVSVVTHELRLPLTSIKGYTDLMRGGMVGPVTDQQKNFLNVIRNNVERMTALISDLSDISHLETGRMKLADKPTAVRMAVDEALSPWQPKFDEKGITVVVDIPSELPVLQTDTGRLVQVLGYLLSNALKYTPSGGKVTLRGVQEGRMVRLEVVDTGIGISAEDQKKLFQPFFRSEDEAVREYPGWGLALHLSKSLIEALRGQMGFVSALKAGSTFWLALPLP